jgi:hypothetical protein
VSTFGKIFGLLLIGAVAYFLINERPLRPAKLQEKALAPPGWEQLDACSPMQSLIGTSEIAFQPNHTVSVTTEDVQSGTKPSVGSWAYDMAAKRYLITFGAHAEAYALVRPKDSEVCILVRGDETSANMTESWYGRTMEDLRDMMTNE